MKVSRIKDSEGSTVKVGCILNYSGSFLRGNRYQLLGIRKGWDSSQEEWKLKGEECGSISYVISKDYNCLWKVVEYEADSFVELWQ